MPKNRIRPRHCLRTPLEQLTDEQLRELETGQPFFDFSSLEELQRLWEVHQDRLLQDWQRAQPGRRPFCYWLFLAYPTYGPRRTSRHWTLSHEQHRDSWLQRGILFADTLPPLLEFQAEYLQRHGLLTAHEQSVLRSIPAADDWRTWGDPFC